MKWICQDGPKGDIALSSRVRLARNLSDIPFPGAAGSSWGWVDEISDVLLDAGGGMVFHKTDIGSPLKLQSLVERHAISPGFASSEHPRALIRSSDGGVSVMVGEEDHIRLQAFAPGLDLNACLTEAFRVDDLLDSRFGYAFSETLGYLTSCPTNLGTGLRASVMLHLPALTKTGALRSVAHTAGQMGFTVRGIYGEGTKALGDLYQLSNQGGMGFGESDLIRRTTEAARQIIASERATRELMRQQNGPQISDMIWRSYGLLTHARLLTTDEAMEHLGMVRVGAALGEITHVPVTALNRLLVETQTATLMLEHDVTKEACPAKRAEIIRRTLNEQG